MAGSIERSKNRTLAPALRTMSPRSASVAAIPSSPPTAAISTDSVTSARTMRPRLAPSDARIAISCSRAVHCAITRMATFAQAISSVSSTQAPSSHGQHERHRLAERRPLEPGHLQPQLALGGGQPLRVLGEPGLQLLREHFRRDAGPAPDDDLETGLGWQRRRVEHASRSASSCSKTRSARASRRRRHVAGRRSRSWRPTRRRCRSNSVSHSRWLSTAGRAPAPSMVASENVRPSAASTPRTVKNAGVTARTGTVSRPVGGRGRPCRAHGVAAANADPDVTSRHALKSRPGTWLPIGAIGRSGEPTWTRDSCAGSR